MKTIRIGTSLPRVLTLAVWLVASGSAAASTEDSAATNARVVEQAFEDWKQGEGTVFDLLAEDATWVVAGFSPVSGTYDSKQTFLDEAVAPIVGRLATPIVPEVQDVIAQGNDVVVIWRGSAETTSGTRYENDYAWHLQMRDGEIQHVNAFLDTWALDVLMQ